MISPTILLVYPPSSHLQLPCWDAAVVAGVVPGSGQKSVYYDANLDFYKRHLCSRAGISSFFQQIQKKRRAGHIPEEIYSRLKKKYENILETGVDINGFKTDKFYDPHCFVSLKNTINDCLILASHSYSPADFNRNLYEHRGDKGDCNPFSLLWKQDLEREIKQHGPGAVVFFVSSMNQAVYAQAMALHIKSRYPEVLVVAMTTARAGFLGSQYFDHVIQNQGQKGAALLVDFFSHTHGAKIGLQTVMPDYSGMHMDQYPMPGKVVLVHPLFFKDPVLLSDFLEKQVNTLGIRGFIFVKVPSVALIFQRLAHWLSIKQPNVYFCIQIPLEKFFPEGDKGDDKLFSILFTAGLRLIIWQKDGKTDKIPEKILWSASRPGIWNHVTGIDLLGDLGQAKFIVNNPNIVHSFAFQNMDQDKNKGQDEIFNLSQYQMSFPPVVEGLMDYAGVQPLPGIPFWKVLEDPVSLLLYLSKMTRKSLGRLRVDLAKHSVISLGSGISYTYQRPEELFPGIMDEICRMVEAGGSVDITHVRSNLEKAYLIGYAVENGVIIGNSSLKHPRRVFIKRLKQMTGVDFTSCLERGYTSVRPEYRAMGVGTRLLQGLTCRVKNHKVFSIIKEDNLATQKIALRNNTKKILTYISEKLNKEMGVWMPAAMIDQELENIICSHKDRER